MKTYENPLTNHIQHEDVAPMSYRRIIWWTEKKSEEAQSKSVNGGGEGSPDALITALTRRRGGRGGEDDEQRPTGSQRHSDAPPRDGAASFSRPKKKYINKSIKRRVTISCRLHPL